MAQAFGELDLDHTLGSSSRGKSQRIGGPPLFVKERRALIAKSDGLLRDGNLTLPQRGFCQVPSSYRREAQHPPGFDMSPC